LWNYVFTKLLFGHKGKGEKMSIEKKVSQRIFFEREKRGLTSTEFADALGITQPCIKKWEDGKTIPNSRQLIKMFEVFGICPCMILLGRLCTEKS